MEMKTGQMQRQLNELKVLAQQNHEFLFIKNK